MDSKKPETSLIERIKTGTGNVKRIPFPGVPGSEVAFRVISIQEVQDAIFETEQYFRRLKIDVSQSSIDAYEDERSTQVLWRALRDPDDPSKPAAPSAAVLRRSLSKEEKRLSLLSIPVSSASVRPITRR